MISDVRIMRHRGTMPRIIARWLLATAAAIATTATATAQTTTGSIRGYVRGPNDAPVPDAAVLSDLLPSAVCPSAGAPPSLRCRCRADVRRPVAPEAGV